MKKYLSILFLAFMVLPVFSQTHVHTRNCGHTSYQNSLMQDQNYASAFNERMARFEAKQQQVAIEGRAQCPDPVTLPMAVHFENITNPDYTCLVALAQQQVQILNDDYAGTNADISNWINNASGSFPGVSNGETCIAFCLATSNHPNGYGLTEGQPAVTVNQFNGDNAPAFSGYINIFVRNIGGGILGYSPYGGQGNGDGVTIGTSYFSSGAGCGQVSPSAPFNQGRTLTHELGHFLLLNHIWGDGGCGVDDQVSDTPIAGSAYGGCPTIGQSSCGTTDMHMNYMDYVDDACMYMFSAGQSTRMENYVASNLQNVANNFSNVCAPVVPVAPTADITGPSSVCANQGASFADNSAGTPTSWSWSFPGGSPSSSNAQSPPTVTYANPGTYTVSLTVSNAQGSDSESVQITVNDCGDCLVIDNLGAATLVLLEVPQAQGGGYVAGHNGYGDIAKADYFTGIAANSELQGAEFDFGGAVGTGDIEFVIWADNGGSPGAELFTDLIPVSTIEADAAAGNNTMVDFGGTISIPTSFFMGFKIEYGNNTIAILTNTDGETAPATAWEQWSDGNWYAYDDGDSWGISVAHAIYPNICAASTGGPQAPVANFSTSTISQGCETIQVQYTDNSSNTPTSWAWTFPGGTPANSTDQNPVVAYTSGGSYNATLVATNAAGNNSTTQNGVVTVPNAITANGSASTLSVDLAVSGMVNFTGTTTGGTSWSWDFGDGNTSSMQNPSHTYTAEGSYNVILTVTDGFCTEMINVGTVVVNNSTGIENIEGLNSMSIYPNPVSNTLNIELVSDQALEIQVEVFDAVGRKVMNGNVMNVMGSTFQTLDATKLATGTYFVRITSGSNTATAKFLKF